MNHESVKSSAKTRVQCEKITKISNRFCSRNGRVSSPLNPIILGKPSQSLTKTLPKSYQRLTNALINAMPTPYQREPGSGTKAQPTPYQRHANDQPTPRFLSSTRLTLFLIFLKTQMRLNTFRTTPLYRPPIPPLTKPHKMAPQQRPTRLFSIFLDFFDFQNHPTVYSHTYKF